MNVGIVGSRTFDDYELLKKTMLDEYGDEGGNIKSVIYRIVSGGAEGADSLAKKFADEVGSNWSRNSPIGKSTDTGRERFATN